VYLLDPGLAISRVEVYSLKSDLAIHPARSGSAGSLFCIDFTSQNTILDG
jgi:hypothetical protein